MSCDSYYAACERMPDEWRAMKVKLATLEAENAALKAENAALRERVEAWRIRWDAMTLDAIDPQSWNWGNKNRDLEYDSCDAASQRLGMVILFRHRQNSIKWPANRVKSLEFGVSA